LFFKAGSDLGVVFSVPKYIYKFVSYLSQDSIFGLPTRLNDRMYATYMCGDNN